MQQDPTLDAIFGGAQQPSPPQSNPELDTIFNASPDDAAVRKKFDLFPGAPVTDALRADVGGPDVGASLPPSTPFSGPPPSFDPLSLEKAPPERSPTRLPVTEALQKEYGETAGGLLGFATHLASGIEPLNPFADSPERIIAKQTVERNLGPEPVDFAESQQWRAAIEWEMKQPRTIEKANEYRRTLGEEQDSDPLSHAAHTVGSMGQFLLNTATFGKVLPGSGPLNRIASMGAEEAVVPAIKQNAPEGSTLASRFKEGVETGVLYELTGGIGRKFAGKLEDPILRNIFGEGVPNAALAGALAPKGEKIQSALEGGLIGTGLGAMAPHPNARERTQAELSAKLESQEVARQKEQPPAVAPAAPPDVVAANKIAFNQRPPEIQDNLYRAKQAIIQGTATAAKEITFRSEVNKALHDLSSAVMGTTSAEPQSGRGTPKLKKGVLGWFAPARIGGIPSGSTALRVLGDAETWAHEIGHQIHKALFPMASKQPGQTTLDPEPELLKKYESELSKITYDKNQPIVEGFSEATRLLVTDPATLQKHAPGFYKEFGEYLESTHPEVAKRFKDAQETYGRWVNQSSLQRAQAAIYYPTWRSRLPSLSDLKEAPDKLYSALINDAHPGWKIADALERQLGRELPADEHPGLVMEALRNANGVAERFLNEGVVDAETQQVRSGSKSLYGILKSVSLKDTRPLDGYLLMRRIKSLLDEPRPPHEAGRQAREGWLKRKAVATERLKQLGMDKSQISQALTDAEAANPKFRQVADDVQEWRSGLLDYLVDKRVMSLEERQAMEKTNPFYVPMKSSDAALAMEAMSGSGRSLVNLPSMAKRFKGGSQGEMVSPIVALHMQTHSMIRTAARAEASRVLIESILQLDSSGANLIEKVNKPIRGINFSLKEIKKQLEKEGVDLEDVDLGASLSIFRPDELFAALKKNGVVSFIGTDGERVMYRIKDPALERMVGSLNDTGTAASKLARTLLWPLIAYKGMKQAAIVSDLGFMVANLTRDVPTYFVTTGRVPTKLFQSFFDTMFKKGWWKQWEEAGGGLHTIAGSELRSAYREVTRAVEGTRWQGAAWHPFEVVNYVASLFEHPLRVNAFRHRMEEPLPQDVTETAQLYRALHESAESTVDFGRRGWLFRHPLFQTVAFLNPGLQGLDRMNRAIAENPTRFALVAGLYAGFHSLVRLWNASPDDDEPEDRYWKEKLLRNRPQRERDLNTVIIAGTKQDPKILKIPKAHEVGFSFGTTTEHILDKFLDDPENVEWLEKFGIKAWAPDEWVRSPTAGNFLADAAEIVLPNMVPDLVVAGGEWLANKNFFRDVQVVPERERDVAASEQYGPDTSEAAKWIGSKLGVSPRKIDNAFRIGAVRDVSNITDEVVRSLRDEEAPKPEKGAPWSTPLLREVVSRFSARYPSTGTKAVDDFYKESGKVSEALATYKKKLDEAPDKDPQSEVPANYFLEHKHDLALSQMANKVADQLGQYRKAIREIYSAKDLNATQKQKFLDYYAFRMDDLAKTYLEESKRLREVFDLSPEEANRIRSEADARTRESQELRAKEIGRMEQELPRR